MNVHFHIDRLVLEGLDVPHASRAALRAAVEQELTRLVTAGGIAPELAGGIAMPSVHAPQITVQGTPAQLGTSIAGAVYGGVGGGTGAKR